MPVQKKIWKFIEVTSYFGESMNISFAPRTQKTEIDNLLEEK